MAEPPNAVFGPSAHLSSTTTTGMLPDVREYCSRCLVSQTSFQPPRSQLTTRSSRATWALSAFQLKGKWSSAQPQELALQHVKRPIDSVHGLRLISCLARSPSRQLAMPVGMPASAREAEKGAIACAVAASLPGSRLLSRLVEPATELARYVPLFPSRIDRPSPDKSAAARAEFRERVLLPVFHRLRAQSRCTPSSTSFRGR